LAVVGQIGNLPRQVNNLHHKNEKG
jgi:hypothetical protein